MELKFIKNGICVGRVKVERFMVKGEVWPFYERLPEKITVEVKAIPKIQEGSNFKDDAIVVEGIDPWCAILYIDPDYMKKLGVNVEIKEEPFVRKVEPHEREDGRFLVEAGKRKKAYLNGIMIGTHDNVLYKGEIPVEYVVSKVKKRKDEIFIYGYYKTLFGDDLRWYASIFVPRMKDKYQAIRKTAIYFDTKDFEMKDLPDNARMPIWDLVYKASRGLISSLETREKEKEDTLIKETTKEEKTTKKRNIRIKK